jgi:hypothetical protein
MNALIAVLLFAGLVMVVHSIYEEKYKRLKREVRVEYRFIPRTLYEEQMAQSDVSGLFRSMFNDAAPWYGEAKVPGAPGLSGRSPGRTGPPKADAVRSGAAP